MSALRHELSYGQVTMSPAVVAHVNSMTTVRGEAQP